LSVYFIIIAEAAAAKERKKMLWEMAKKLSETIEKKKTGEESKDENGKYP